MVNRLDETIRDMLHHASQVLIVSHIRPDGDAIGSLLGLGLALEKSGKEVQMVLSDSVPANFRHLKGSEKVRTRAEAGFDLSVVLDCSDISRTGEALKTSKEDDYLTPDLNIDHHITNLNFARVNLVETTAVATSEVIARHLRAWNLPLNHAIATALLNGIITDTIGFRTSNVTPGAMRIVADLMEAGADLPYLYNEALLQRSFQAARFWGVGLTSLKRDGPLIWTALSQQDRHSVEYPGRDDADLVNILSSIDDAAIAVVFVEQPNGKVKISWRAQPGLDVAQIALRFGGGGHQAASGAEIAGTLEEVQEKVLKATRELLSGP